MKYSKIRNLKKQSRNKIHNIKLNSYIKKTSIILLTIILLTSIRQVTALSITEIMFNPQGADTGREWIELHVNETDGCINLTEYRLFEEETNHHFA